MELYGEVLPFIMEWLPKNDFLKLRSVSRGWKQGLDNVYENHPARLASTTSDIHFPKLVLNEESEEPAQIALIVDNGMEFSKHDQIQRFLRETDVNSGNPFPGRCAQFSLRGNELVDRPELLQSLTQLLIRFGDHIWYLRLWFRFDPPMYLTDVEALLMNWLTHVPNLKRLKLELGPPRGDASALNVDFWRQHPAQKLNNLQLFSYIGDGDPEEDPRTPLIELLLERFCANGNLKRLHLPAPTMFEHQVPLPNLEELCAYVFFENLPQLKETSPKLEKLILLIDEFPENHEHWNHHETGYNCHIDTLFNGFQIFADTLKELDILENSGVTFIPPNSADYRVDLPKLERLTLGYFPMDNINILLNLSSLKHLEIQSKEECDTGEFAQGVFERMSTVDTVVIWEPIFENRKQRRVYRRQS